MSAGAPAWRPLDYDRLRIPTAAFEVLAYLTVIAAASLAFLAGWLTVNAAVVLTVALLTTLIVLSWIHLGQGRHPCFLFLCTLMFFQGGRLLMFTVGAEPDPMRIRAMAVDPYSIGRAHEAIVLLCLALSAVCIYAVCRWNYVPLRPPDPAPVRRYLPYLYLLFALTMPAQIIKNSLYYQYVLNHGGYLSIYQNYAGLAASAPLIVRAIALFTLPAYVAIFVFERRRPLVWLVTVLYFSTAFIILLWGSRLFVFALILTLWYVARIKSARRSRVMLLIPVLLVLALVAQSVQNLREDSSSSEMFAFDIAKFLALEGMSIDVTEIAVKYRERFSPYAGSYLLNELQESFIANDIWNYTRGKSLDYDVSVTLNPVLFGLGSGVGSSYIGEAYVIGGVGGVLLISLLVGGGLQVLHRNSAKPVSLLIIALTMPIVLYMPRGDLLGWLSALARSLALLLLIGIGWQVYSFVTSIKPVPSSSKAGSPASSAGI